MHALELLLVPARSCRSASAMQAMVEVVPITVQACCGGRGPSTFETSIIVNLAARIRRSETRVSVQGADLIWMAATIGGDKHDRRPRYAPMKLGRTVRRNRPSARPHPWAACAPSPRCPSHQVAEFFRRWSDEEDLRRARSSESSSGARRDASTPRSTDASGPGSAGGNC